MAPAGTGARPTWLSSAGRSPLRRSFGLARPGCPLRRRVGRRRGCWTQLPAEVHWVAGPGPVGWVAGGIGPVGAGLVAGPVAAEAGRPSQAVGAAVVPAQGAAAPAEVVVPVGSGAAVGS